jgi:hypothetical protein
MPIDTNQASNLLKVAGVGYSLNDLLASLGASSSQSGKQGPARAAGEPPAHAPACLPALLGAAAGRRRAAMLVALAPPRDFAAPPQC